MVAPSVTTSGDITKDILGYTFVSSNGAAWTGNYAVNEQTVNYVYSRNLGTIDVTYIDQTTNQILIRKDLFGGTNAPSNYTTSVDIKSYTDAGYELVSENYPSNRAVLRDTPQHYVVYLK